MVSSVGSSRGYLRPFARSPPVLLIVLILICGISVFNYWNLSSQYNDVVKEISDLQEHIRIVTSKHETAEKLVEALHEKLRSSEDQIGKLKINLVERSSSLNEVKKQVDIKNDEILRLGNKLKQEEDVTKLHHEAKTTLQHDLEKLKAENSILVEKNAVLHNTLTELKAKTAAQAQQFKVPDIVKVDPLKTAAQTYVTQALTKESNKTEDSAIVETDVVTEKDEEARDNEEDNNVTEANSAAVNNPNFEYSIQDAAGAIQSAIDAKIEVKNPIIELLRAKSEYLKNVTARILSSNSTTGTTTTVGFMKKMAEEKPQQANSYPILGV